MGMVNDTTRLLGLAGLAVVKVEDGLDGGPVVHLATADEQARCCSGFLVRQTCTGMWRKGNDNWLVSPKDAGDVLDVMRAHISAGLDCSLRD